MDSLFLLQFACCIFMLLNAGFVAVFHLHVRWENERYERSRWMLVASMIGLAIQYMMQMFFGFRAVDDGLGAVINILIYTPCFSLISMGIYNFRDSPYQLSEDELGVRWYLCCHPPGLLREYLSSSKSVYPRRTLSDARPVWWKCSLLHIHDNERDTKT